MAEAYQAPVGTRDVLPPESARWAALHACFADACQRANYGRLLTPLFEDVGVFRRVGEGTDVVRKEMYDFEDKGGRRLALRPEGTAPVVRAFVQHHPPTPWKVWYAAPSFRYERPQAGRYRQHHQLGAEVLGSDDPDVDVELIGLACAFFAELGLRRVLLLLNSMGDATCRPAYVERLAAYLSERLDELCDEHRPRALEHPLRVLDCKREGCRAATRDAPRVTDHLCVACDEHFRRVQEGLGAVGVNFALEPRLVRGFDYYTRTTFEVQASALQTAQNAVGGGGRYDGLTEELGGPPTPGMGFGLGVERTLLACDAEGVFAPPPPAVDVWVVDVAGGDAARDLTAALRREGVVADRAFDHRSMRAQMKGADRSGARLALIVGEEEAAEGAVTVRDLRGSAGQERVPREKVVDHVKGRL